MSNIDNMTTGNIITDKETGTRYRIIYVSVKNIVLCEMDITKFVLISMSYMQLVDFMQEHNFTISDDKGLVFDENNLSENIKTKYIRNRDMMNEIVAAYGPTFLGLSGKKPKKRLYEILEKYNCSSSTFWRLCVKYFQSGMKTYTLVDGKTWSNVKGKELKRNVKSGKHSEYVESGIVVNDKVREQFEDALNHYKKAELKVSDQLLTG